MSQSARPIGAAPLADGRAARELLERVASNVGRVVLGKPAQSRTAISCLVARGHLLIEDVPGVGKTTLAEALAITFALSFARIQFTADLLPSDILGASIFLPNQGRFEFRTGPLFHQLVLADELNRAPPRTQSALLEAMAHSQVSVDGTSHPLPSPFAVIATQNPVDLSGTYPLPDSQLDRFLVRISVGHPAPEVEAQLLMSRGQVDPIRELRPVAHPAELQQLQQLAASVSVDESVAQYVIALVGATRKHAEIERGASTRAALALLAAAKSHALWDARSFVTPGDIRAVLGATLAHRMLLRSALQGTFSRDEAGHLLEEIVRKTPAPR